MTVWANVSSPWSGSIVDNSYALAVCWSADIGLFVAVGFGYPSPGPVLTSPDGVTWTARAAADAVALSAVCWSPTRALFVATATDVAGEGDDYPIYTSPDGVTWTGRAVTDMAEGYAVCWSPTLALFVAALIGFPPTGLFTSPDGVTWTAATTPWSTTGLFSAVCWSPTLELLVAGGYNSSNTEALMTSPDGVTWTVQSTPFDIAGVISCGWSPSAGVLIAGAANSLSGGSTAMMTSPDGVTWTERPSPLDGHFDDARAYTDTGVNAVAGGNHGIVESLDGVTWTADTVSLSEIYGLAYSPSLGLAVAVGSGDFAIASASPAVPGATPFFHHSYPSS